MLPRVTFRSASVHAEDRKSAETSKGVRIDIRDLRRDKDIGEVRAVGEGALTDSDRPVRQLCVGKGAAESLLTDLVQIIRQNKVGLDVLRRVVCEQLDARVLFL